MLKTDTTYRGVEMFLTPLFDLLYKIEVRGGENVRKLKEWKLERKIESGGVAIFSNHTSKGDPFVLIRALKLAGTPRKPIHYVAVDYTQVDKGWVAYLTNKLYEFTGMVMISKGEKPYQVVEHAGRGNRSKMDETKDLMRMDRTVGYFPEAGINKNSKLGLRQELKPGSAKVVYEYGGVIIPTRLEGVCDIWPKGKAAPRIYGNMKISFGEPIYTRDPIYNEGSSEIATGPRKTKVARRLTEEFRKRFNGLA